MNQAHSKGELNACKVCMHRRGVQRGTLRSECAYQILAEVTPAL